MTSTFESLEQTDATTGEESEPAPRPGFEVRRRVGLAVALGAAASVVATAYLVRATGGGTALDWAVAGVMALVALAYVAALLDSRAPLLVADRLGVRIRTGRAWTGVAWSEVELVEHLPRRSWLRDGWILVARSDDPDLTVPLSISTRLVGLRAGEVSAVLDTLADGRVEIVEIDPSLEDAEAVVDAEAVEDVEQGDTPEATETPEVARTEETEETDAPDAPEPTDESRPDEPAPTPVVTASPAPLPLRDPRIGVRSEVERDATVGATALRLDHDDDDTRAWQLPELAHLRRDVDAGSDRDAGERTVVLEYGVLPIARAGEPVTPVVIDEFAVEPAPDPVIGPELAAARTRLGLSVDQLSERTRIRPHVIESIEVDDFAPCGGDFYARGHLRTLARILGISATPLLASYDERYADAPIDPRRVFQADLAAASGGSLRATRGGPNWSVLVAAVMAVVLVWSVARLVMDGPVSVTPTIERLNGSNGPNNAAAGAAAPVPVVLTAAGGGARVVARDGAGEIVFDGQLAFNQQASFRAAPPVRVSTTDGSLEIELDGEERGAVGSTGQQAQQTYVVR